MLEKLSFEIKEAEVLYNAESSLRVSASHKVLYRSDNLATLSVMKNSYYPMFNQHFMETTEKMSEISGFKIAGYSEPSNGVIVVSHLENNIEDFSIGGHKIKDYLVLGSSCDGKHQFFIGTTTELIRCQNQFSRITNLEKVRHTKSAPKKIEELLSTLEVYFKQRKEMYQNFNRMLEYEVDDEVKDLAIAYLLQLDAEEMLEGNVSTRKLNQAEQLDLAMSTEMDAVGHNLWGLFNGGTQYSTHILKQQKNVIFGNLFGSAADINKRAYNFSMAQLQ